MRFGVVRFPGSCDDLDAKLACERVGDAVLLWHGDRDLRGVDAVVIPGGFSYGDYLRVGAIARFAPVMEVVGEFARAGGPVLGICNGFQVLCEAGLLPGALLPNAGLRFLCRQVTVEVLDADTAWTGECAEGDELAIPVKHQAGRYVPGPDGAEAVRTVLRYAGPPAPEGRGSSSASQPGRYGNPNGSTNDIAGVANAEGNVVGLMPHPEHAVDPLTGSVDGLALFRSADLARVGV